MFIHLGTLASAILPLAGYIVPVVMWQMKRDEASEIDEHGREVANALLSYTIYTLVSIVLCLVLVGFAMLLGLYLASIILPIIGAVKANDGQLYRYPLNLRLI